MKRTVRVYIAGPYTKPDPAVNTRVAMLVWNKLWKLGYIPTVPHWSMFQHFLLLLQLSPHIIRLLSQIPHSAKHAI